MFSTIFDRQPIKKKKGTRRHMENCEDTYDKIFGQREQWPTGESVEDEEDTFKNIYGITRQPELLQRHC